MARSPVEDCPTCHGEGIILRPEVIVEHDITLRKYEDFTDGDRLLDVEVPTITKLGGIDVCPVCAAKAEALFHAGDKPVDPDSSDDTVASNVLNLATHRRRA